MARFEKLAKARRFGPYELTHRVDSSSPIGELYRATHRGVEGFEKPLVIKEINAKLSAHQPFLDVLAAKAAAAVKLHHANIVQVLDLGQSNASYYLATEFVAGVDLGEVLSQCKRHRRSIPQAMVVLVALEVVKALDHAHRRKDSRLQLINFCHQGLTPRNILLSWDGEVKVTDFGLHAAFETLPQALRPKETWLQRYQAPEVGEGKTYTPESDVYALGLILYEALTGVHPFDTQIDNSQRTGVFQAVEDWVDVDLDLIHVVDQALALEPASRGAGVSEIYQQLLQLTAKHSLRANPRQLSDWLAEITEPVASPPSTDDLAAPPGLSVSVGDGEPKMQASGIWGIAAPQQREFLQLPPRSAPAGIEEPIELLRRGYVDVQRSGGRAFLITGESGSGKSFVLRYALSLFAEAGSACHVAYLPQVAQSTPFGVLGAWFSSAAGLSPTDAETVAGNKVRVLASSLDFSGDELDVVLFLCGATARLVVEPSRLPKLAEGVLVKLVSKLADLGPVLLSVDNVHFVDRKSYHLLLGILERIRDYPVLLLLAAQDPSYARYFEHETLLSIELKEPAGETRARIIEGLLRDEEVSGGTMAYLQSAPESLVRVQELIVLARLASRSGYTLEQSLQMFLMVEPSRRLATTLHALSPAEIQVLQWLAAAIEPLHVLLLKRLVNLPAPMLHSVLQALLRAELIVYAAPGRLAFTNSELGEMLLSLYDLGLMNHLTRILRETLKGLAWSKGLSHSTAHVQLLGGRGGDVAVVLREAQWRAQALDGAGFAEIALVHSQRTVGELSAMGRVGPSDRARALLEVARRSCATLRLDIAGESLEQAYQSVGLQGQPELLAEALAVEARVRHLEGEDTEALSRLDRASEIGQGALPSVVAQRCRIHFECGDLNAAGRLSGEGAKVLDRLEAMERAWLETTSLRIAVRSGERERAQQLLRQILQVPPSGWGCAALQTLAEADYEVAFGTPKVAAEAFERVYLLTSASGHFEVMVSAALPWVDFLLSHRRAKRVRQLLSSLRSRAKGYPLHRLGEALVAIEHYLAAAYRGEAPAMSALSQAFTVAQERGRPCEVIRIGHMVRDALERQGRPVEAERVAAQLTHVQATWGYRV